MLILSIRILLNCSAKPCLCRGSGIHIHLSNICWQCSLINIMIRRGRSPVWLISDFFFFLPYWRTKCCLDLVRKIPLISGHKFILCLPGHFPENNWVAWECYACAVLFLRVRRLKQLLAVHWTLLSKTSGCFSHYLLQLSPFLSRFSCLAGLWFGVFL